jgi:hypothetical protein
VVVCVSSSRKQPRGPSIAVAADETIYVDGEEGVNFETREGVLLAWSPPHVAVAQTRGTQGFFGLTRIAATGDIEWPSHLLVQCLGRKRQLRRPRPMHRIAHWQNAHIIPASTFNYGLGEGPNGSATVGEIVDGPENYLWVEGFE